MYCCYYLLLLLLFLLLIFHFKNSQFDFPLKQILKTKLLEPLTPSTKGTKPTKLVHPTLSTSSSYLRHQSCKVFICLRCVNFDAGCSKVEQSSGHYLLMAGFSRGPVKDTEAVHHPPMSTNDRRPSPSHGVNLSVSPASESWKELFIASTYVCL